MGGNTAEHPLVENFLFAQSLTVIPGWTWKGTNHGHVCESNILQAGKAVSLPPRGAKHLPGVLDHRGGELPRPGGGTPGGGPEEDGVVLEVEGGPPRLPVLHAGQHLLERHAVRQDQPQHQGSVPGRRRHGPRVEVGPTQQNGLSGGVIVIRHKGLLLLCHVDFELGFVVCHLGVSVE